MGNDDYIEQVKIRNQQILEELRRQREYDEEQSEGIQKIWNDKQQKIKKEMIECQLKRKKKQMI